MKQWQLLAIAGIMITAIVFAPLAESAIPPTRAWLRILTHDGNVTANSYAANLTLRGDGIGITTYYANNTLRLSATTPQLALEDLSNVTSGGCALGQVRTVGAGGIWVCSNAAGGDVSGAANVGTGTGEFFRDEVLGTLNFKTLDCGSGLSCTNNADTVAISATGGGGNATVLKDLGDVSQQLNATKGNVFVANGTHWNGVKVGSDGQVLTADSTKQFGVNWSTVSSTLKVDNQTVNRKEFLVGLNNATGDWTKRTFALNNQTYVKGDIQVIGINNVTGVVTTNQFSVNTRDCGSNFVKSIDNVTGNVVCAAASGSSTDAQQTKRWGSFTPTSATAALDGFLTTSTTLEGTETLSYNTTRGVLGIDVTTGAVGGLRYAGILQNATNFNIFRGDQNSYLWIESAPAGSQFAGSRFFIGFKSSQQIIPRSDTIVDSISAFGICKRTTDTNYMRCENDGAGAGTYTSLGVAANANWHTFKVYATSNGASWCAELDGGTASCTSADIPATTTRLYWEAVANQNPGTSVKTMRYGYVYVQNDK